MPDMCQFCDAMATVVITFDIGGGEKSPSYRMCEEHASKNKTYRIDEGVQA